MALPQHLEALERAKAVRSARASVKRRLMSREVRVTDLLRPGSIPSAIQNMQIGALLMAQRQWGRKKALRLLNRVQIAETRKVGSLTDREMTAVNAEIRALGRRR